MAKSSLDFNPRTNRWEVKGRNGDIELAFGEGGLYSKAGVKAGSSGTTMGQIRKLTGTLPATNVGSAAGAVVTITGMTGLAIGDMVFITPKVAFTDANLGIGAVRIPTTNTLNVTLINHRAATAGSTAAIGVDVLAFRSD